MDPLTAALIGSAITGIAQGTSSYMGMSAQREAEKRAAEQQALAGEYGMKKSAIAENTQRQQSALADLINAFRGSLE